jgi:hypothetical protein
MRKLVVLLLIASAGLAAQDTEPVSLAPIECYWRTGASAVRVGEVFGLGLTCAVLETAATTVVPDQSRLDPDVLQLQPFEVVGGTAGDELRTATRRLFQYEYQVRYLGEEIGRDLQIPALTITYRVQSRVQPDSAAVESRERQYILPARPVRVLSLMTGGPADIREPAPPGFAEIQDRRFTASVLRIVSWVCFALGGVVAAWALARALRQRGRHSAVAVRLASDSAVLRGVARELAAVRAARQPEGWTDALAARALAALRVASNYEVDRPVAQVPGRDLEATTGQLRVSGGWRSGAVLLSGSATPAHLARERSRAEAAGDGRSARLGDLHDALTRFAAATYGRDHASLDGAALDEALETGGRAVAGLRREHGWVATRLRAAAHALAGLRSRAWAR